MAQGRNTLMDPPIEELLDKVDSKFTLVALGSARARQVNSYYNSLGEGLGKVVPPQVASVSGKPVSIAFEEIAAGKATYTRPDPEEEAALAAAIADAAEAGLLERGRGQRRGRGHRSARRRGRRPDRELGGRRRGGRRPWPTDQPLEARPRAPAPSRPRGVRRDRRLQGRRGLPPPGRRRRARDAGAHARRHAFRRPADVLRAGVRAGPALPVGRGVADPAHEARPARRPRRGGAGDGAHTGALRRRPLRRPPHGHPPCHPGARHRLSRHAHRDVGAPLGAENLATLERRGVEIVPPESRSPRRRRLGGGAPRRPRRDRGPGARRASARPPAATCRAEGSS